ncbi:MAG TPA: hypothetical protein D7I06_06405 [Candidatus Poseidoniales archaeon]|nr:MAG TPA: hypothetical protein D7I06_06405 [Candidatus Poseidoniales archaeon]|tara:strand:+ start:555 stop:1178 length:624 start_codon:yes stop_codon:yes gene_type:complete
MEENIMAILETLARSRRLCEKRSVVILMYPSHLKDQVKPGQKLTLYHGSTEKNLRTLVPVNDYAVRHGFAKQRNRMLQPLLFLTASPLTAAAYAIPETHRTQLRKIPSVHQEKHRPEVMKKIGASFGSVYVKELQLPRRFSSKPFIVERIVSNELDQIIVATNRAITPQTKLTSLQDTFRQDPRRKEIEQKLKRIVLGPAYTGSRRW